MKKTIDILKVLPWFLLGGVFILISLPFMLVVFPIMWVSNQIRKMQFKHYLTHLEGKNFFCYNNKSKCLEFIENNVLPNLPESVEVIFVNGRTPESAYDQKFISHALHGFKNYRGFPHLLKIRNGRAFDESLNNELFNTIQQEKPISRLFDRMVKFFEL